MERVKSIQNSLVKFIDLLKDFEKLEGEIICVMPDDAGLHDEWNPRCHCQPYVQANDSGYVIIHNKLDDATVSELVPMGSVN